MLTPSASPRRTAAAGCRQPGTGPSVMTSLLFSVPAPDFIGFEPLGMTGTTIQISRPLVAGPVDGLGQALIADRR
jgi:hypothetical protein